MGKFFTGSWFGLIAIITARSLLNGQGLPKPSQLIAGDIAWSMLAILAQGGPEYVKLATILGAGITTGVLTTNADIFTKIKPPSSGVLSPTAAVGSAARSGSIAVGQVQKGFA